MTSTEKHIVVERSHFVRAQQQRSIEALSLPRLRRGCRVLRRRTVVAPSASSSSSSAAFASAAARWRPRRPSQSSEAARAGRGPTPRGAQTRGPRRPWAGRRPWTTGRGRCPSSVADASPKDELSGLENEQIPASGTRSQRFSRGFHAKRGFSKRSTPLVRLRSFGAGAAQTTAFPETPRRETRGFWRRCRARTRSPPSSTRGTGSRSSLRPPRTSGRPNPGPRALPCSKSWASRD